jgi:large subunit ribosomal protein L25
MAATEQGTLTATARDPDGSRDARRLRRSGRVPGVVYGGGDEPLTFSVDERELRHALHAGGAVIELSVDGGKATPVVVKDEQRHPVNGALVHIDLLRVRLDKPIQATTVLELTGVDDAPGVKDGGVLEHVTHEITVEALPNAIPDSIQHDVSEMEIGDTVMLDAVQAPAGVTIIGELAEITVATLNPPRVEAEPEEIETETELVGEGEEGAEAAGDAEGGEAPAEGGGDDAAAEDGGE